MSIITPENNIAKEFSPEEFRVIFHRELNNKQSDVERLCEETDMLSIMTPVNDRTFITTLEGDIIEYGNSKEPIDNIYLSHMLYVKRNSEKKFKNAFDCQESIGLAAKFMDVINYLVGQYKSGSREFELDVELKDNLGEPTLVKVAEILKSSGLPHYFASFYGKNLDMIQDLNPEVKTARHTVMSIGDRGYNPAILGMGKPERDPTIIISQYRFRFGNPTSTMHTPMHTPEQLIKMSLDKTIKGAFTDIKLFDEYHSKVFLLPH